MRFEVTLLANNAFGGARSSQPTFSVTCFEEIGQIGDSFRSFARTGIRLILLLIYRPAFCLYFKLYPAITSRKLCTGMFEVRTPTSRRDKYDDNTGTGRCDQALRTIAQCDSSLQSVSFSCLNIGLAHAWTCEAYPARSFSTTDPGSFPQARAELAENCTLRLYRSSNVRISNLLSYPGHNCHIFLQSIRAGRANRRHGPSLPKTYRKRRYVCSSLP
jgi:hypothetical protein